MKARKMWARAYRGVVRWNCAPYMLRRDALYDRNYDETVVPVMVTIEPVTVKRMARAKEAR